MKLFWTVFWETIIWLNIFSGVVNLIYGFMVREWGFVLIGLFFGWMGLFGCPIMKKHWEDL